MIRRKHRRRSGDVDPAHILDLFAAFGPVQVRRMFGGAGLYSGGVMFGLVADDRIYLKADETTVPRFAAAGCGPFEYATRTGRRAVMSYWQMPEHAYDDPDALAQWAAEALKVARDAEVVKRSERSAARKARPNR